MGTLNPNLTDPQVCQMQSAVFGLPQNNSTFAVAAISTLWGPAGEPYDLTRINTAFKLQVTAASLEACTRIGTLLTQWDSDGLDFDGMLIVETATGTKGDIINKKERAEKIRRMISNLLGFFCPKGGFLQEHENNHGDGGGYIGR